MKRQSEKRLSPILTLLTLAIVMVTAACGPSLDPGPIAAPSASLSGAAHSQPPLACRQAIVRGDATDACTSGDPGWRGGLLVATLRNNYCHFVWNAGGKPRFDRLRVGNRIVEVDCPLVQLAAPTADPVDAQLWAGLMNSLQAQVGRTGWQPAPLAPKITVAVIDSAAWPYSDRNQSDTFGHGRLVGRLIADLACPLNPQLASAPGAPGCPLAIDNTLAVPQLPGGGIDTINGGFFGTRGELGEAIGSVLSRWESHPDGERLILNLSLGWPQQLPAGGVSVADEAVAHLLERASCQGALTIAAAGNHSLAQPVATPFLPAFWESQRAPDATACKDLRPAVKADDASIRRVRPLVYAVAAVDQHDSPLLTARPTWTPRLVAHGIGGVAADKRAPGRTLILSGSSIAAAVVSGIAAAIWETGSTRTGPEVIDLIYSSAVVLGAGTPGSGPTSLCLGGPPCVDGQRRASLCGALDLIGFPHDACTTVPAGSGKDPEIPAQAIPVPDGGVGDAPTGQVPCAGADCPAWTLVPDDQPSVWPQPSGAACPSCVLHLSFNNVTGRLGVDTLNRMTSGLIGPTPLTTTVWLKLDNGPAAFPYDLNDPNADFTLFLPAAATKAAISFEFHGVWAGFDTVRTRPQDMPVVAQ